MSLFEQLSSAAEQQSRLSAGLEEKHRVIIRIPGHVHNGRIGIVKAIEGPSATVTIAACVNTVVPYSSLEDLSNE